MKKLLLILGFTIIASTNMHAKCCNDCNSCCFAPCAMYVAGRGSLLWHNELDFNHALGTTTFDYKLGGGGGIAVGYNLYDMCMRFEVEAYYRRNSLDCVNISSTALATDFAQSPATAGSRNACGYMQDVSIMANLYYDFHLSCVTLYVGGGIGIDFNRIKVKSIGGIPISSFTGTLAGYKCAEEDLYFAWNIMAGVAYPLNNCWTLEGGYRLFSKTKISFSQNVGFSKSNVPLTHGLEAGLRYSF